MSLHELPLFPLGSVLFPGTELPLQIFEPRYLDLVRECARTESSFGICLNPRTELSGQAGLVKVGTAARITDWYTRENGLLGIVCRGMRRFTIEETRVQDDGLMIGQVRWLPEENPTDLPLEYSVLATIVARYMEQAFEEYPDFHPSQLEDAVFISYRLAELLPVSNQEKQYLLELDDALARLAVLQRILPRFQK